MKLKILSARSIPLLEELASKYTIKELGSLSISNGQFFLSAMVDIPKTEEAPSKPEGPKEEPKETQEKPKTTRKRRTTKPSAK